MPRVSWCSALFEASKRIKGLTEESGGEFFRRGKLLPGLAPEKWRRVRKELTNKSGADYSPFIDNSKKGGTCHSHQLKIPKTIRQLVLPFHPSKNNLARAPSCVWERGRSLKTRRSKSSRRVPSVWIWHSVWVACPEAASSKFTDRNLPEKQLLRFTFWPKPRSLAAFALLSMPSTRLM